MFCASGRYVKNPAASGAYRRAEAAVVHDPDLAVELHGRGALRDVPRPRAILDDGRRQHRRGALNRDQPAERALAGRRRHEGVGTRSVEREVGVRLGHAVAEDVDVGHADAADDGESGPDDGARWRDDDVRIDEVAPRGQRIRIRGGRRCGPREDGAQPRDLRFLAGSRERRQVHLGRRRIGETVGGDRGNVVHLDGNRADIRPARTCCRSPPRTRRVHSCRTGRDCRSNPSAA